MSTERIGLSGLFADQMAMAVELKRLSDEIAVTRERELTVEKRATDLARANDALQETIDALPTAGDLEYFVPAVLRVVAKAFGARDSAVAREREAAAEQRAADLTKTNKVLRENLANLAGGAQLEEKLGRLLTTAMDQFEAKICNFWVHRDMDEVSLELSHVGGEVLNPAAIAERYPDFPGLQPFRVPPALIGGERIAERRSHYHIAEIATSPLYLALGGQNGIDWYQKHGVKQELNFPLAIGKRTIGALSVYLPGSHMISPAEIELGYALGQQATLAIELTRLAVEAKDAAVSRERGRAAQERGDQFALANEAMKLGSEMIASADSDTAVLGAMLAQAVTATGAAGAAVMRRVKPGSKKVTLSALSQDGESIDVQALIGLPCVVELEAVSVSDPVGYFARLFEGSVQNRLCNEKLASWEPEAAAYHSRNGHKVVWDYPFRDQGEVAGWISLAFRTERDLGETEVQILSALTSHVSLALKMSRLSALAREAAVAEERNRLAGEIHDSLAQSFGGIIMQLESAEDAALNEEPGAMLSSLRRARDVARFGLAEARRSVLALRPAAALAGGLAAALKRLADRTCVDRLLACHLQVSGESLEPLSVEVGTQLFRIAQEAVSNAVRHGKPSQVTIFLHVDVDELLLQVRDDGVGLEALALAEPASAGGITSIRRRTERLGGSCQWTSGSGQGTTLSVKIPRRGQKENTPPIAL